MSDIFENLGGYAGLKNLAKARIDALDGSPKLVEIAALRGYEALDTGRSIERGLVSGDSKAQFTIALQSLALHEQGDVLQPVYDKSYYGRTLRSAVNQSAFMANPLPDSMSPIAPNILGKHMDPNDSLANVPKLQRDLGDLTQRMIFVNDVAKTFENRAAGMGRGPTLDFLRSLRIAPAPIAPIKFGA